MSAAADLLVDGFGRVRELVSEVAGGLDAEQLAFRVDPEANSIAWLLWHLTRVEDDHIADAAGVEQVWLGGGWAERFGLPFAPNATGYGHSSGDVGALRVERAELLVAYHQAVHDQTVRYVAGLADGDLGRIVDERWDPPVTLGVRLVSVIGDTLEHVGQAAFVRGIVTRAS
jgi:hypothetical protein